MSADVLEAAGSAMSGLDGAWAAFMAGRHHEALSYATVSLEAQPEDDEALWLLAVSLGAEGERDPSLAAALQRAAERLASRGDLPRALAVAHALSALDEGASGDLFERLAEWFGRGGVLLDPRAPVSPPALPVPPTSPRGEEDVEALHARALGVLEGWLASVDAPSPRRLPPLPLFSSLPPAPLRELMASMQVRHVPAGERILREGERGEEAFVLARGMARVQRTRAEAPLARLGPGAVFGEMALVSDAPRAADVLAEEPVVLLVLHKKTLEALSERHPTLAVELGRFAHGRMLANLMRHSPVFSALPVQEREALMERFELRRFEPGERVVSGGEEPEGLYLIASGQVQVFARDEDGEKLLLATLGAGDVVGEISLVLRRPASADVLVAAPTVALCLRREAFREAIAAHPRLLNELYDLATKREEETRSVLGQQALDAEEIVLL